MLVFNQGIVSNSHTSNSNVNNVCINNCSTESVHVNGLERSEREWEQGGSNHSTLSNSNSLQHHVESYARPVDTRSNISMHAHELDTITPQFLGDSAGPSGTHTR